MFELMKLPYDNKALEPYMSSSTLDFHHGKHLNAYVTVVNSEIEKDSSLNGKSVEELIKLSYNNPDKTVLFNNVAQMYNHGEFFFFMKKDENPTIPAELKAKIEEDFGSVEAFKEKFVSTGVSQFGSGWVWLVLANGKLEVRKYANAVNPVTDGSVGLLSCDVWEHSYYLDFQNRRADYIKTFVDKLVNWEYVADKYNKAK